MTALLFAYGTLLPGEVRWQFLQPFVVDEGMPDVVGGALFDTGLGFPAAVFDGSAVVHGRVFSLVIDRRDEALALLDEVEGAVDGGYRRRVVTTAAGRRAWAYEYGSGLDLSPIVSGRWSDRRR